MTTTVIKKQAQNGEFIFNFDVHLHLPDGEGTKPEKTSESKIRRMPGDQFTNLTLVQTVLLIQFLQKSRMILNEKDLTYNQAGKAFNILTGFSTHTLRQRLGTKGAIEIVRYEDYEELHAAVLHLARLIEANLYKNKRG